MTEKFTVGLAVANQPGVLNKVTGLYGKRGYNINTLLVEESARAEFSLVTISTSGNAYMKSQVLKQLKKLHDVKTAVLLDGQKASDVIDVEKL